MSYHEFILKVFNHDDEAGQYAKWILAHYTSKITAAPKSQAPDLAAFLKKMRVDVFLGATTAYRRELMRCGLRQEALAWCFHVHADSDSFCMTMQRRLHQPMYLFQIYVSRKFWISGLLRRFFWMHSAIRDDVIYCNHCTWHCL